MNKYKVCPKADTCEKLNMVLDKDFEIELYPVEMQSVCDKCEEVKNESQIIPD